MSRCVAVVSSDLSRGDVRCHIFILSKKGYLCKLFLTYLENNFGSFRQHRLPKFGLGFPIVPSQSIPQRSRSPSSPRYRLEFLLCRLCFSSGTSMGIFQFCSRLFFNYFSTRRATWAPLIVSQKKLSESRLFFAFLSILFRALGFPLASPIFSAI